MKTLGPHPVTADLLHFLCVLDTMIHAWAPFRLRADFPGRINVIYKKLHIQGPSEGRGWREEVLQWEGQRRGIILEAAWGRSRASYHSSDDAWVLSPYC